MAGFSRKSRREDRLFDALDNVVDSHQACENDFFKRARSKKWNRQALLVFAPDYYYWIRRFPGILACLIRNTPDKKSKFFLHEILVSETGSGVKERAHFLLFRQTLEALGLTRIEIDSGPHFEETTALVHGMRALYCDRKLLRALGAQYALERQALPMIKNLYSGCKQLCTLSRVGSEYFQVHLVEEPEHLLGMRRCVERHVGSSDDIHLLFSGAMDCLNLIAAFWARMEVESKLPDTDRAIFSHRVR